MTEHDVLVRDTVAAVHVAGGARNVERLAAGIAFQERDQFGRQPVVVFQAARLQAALQAEPDFGLHVGEFLLDELVRCQRPAELLAIEHVFPRRMPAGFGGAERAPRNAVAGIVQAAHRSLQACGVRQQVFLRHEHAVHDDLAGNRRAQRQLALDLGRAQSVHALVEDESPDTAFVVFCPDDENVRDRRVRDPHLGPGEFVAAVDLAGSRLHATRVRAVIGFRQAEAADEFARCQLRQVLFALRLAAVSVNGVHHEARLHAHHRAVAGVDALDFARNQTVADIAQPGTAVALDRRAEQAELAHLTENRGIGLFLAVRFLYARRQLRLRILPRGIHDQAFVVGELLLEPERVFPVECCPRCRGVRFAHRALCLGCGTHDCSCEWGPIIRRRGQTARGRRSRCRFLLSTYRYAARAACPSAARRNARRPR